MTKLPQNKPSQEAKLSTSGYDPTTETEFETVIIQPNAMQNHEPSENVSVDRTIQTLMHDLKNPLSVIYGTASLLQQQKNLPDSHRDEAIESILSSVDDMRKLISAWLNLSKFENDYALDLQKMPILSFLQHCTQSLIPLAEVTGITLQFEGEAPDIEAEFDHDRMIQAINNLISNAIKYTPEGGQVTVSAHIEEDLVIINITDNGRGISEEDLPYIFDRYYRAKGVRTSNIDGSGLGLAITKAIIQRHNGIIDVMSEAGNGTTFTIKLPLMQTTVLS